MPAEASSSSDEATTAESPTLDPLALLTELLGRMAADPDADAEASAYAQRALVRARAERNAALRSASELVASRSDEEKPEVVAQAMASVEKQLEAVEAALSRVSPEAVTLLGSLDASLGDQAEGTRAAEPQPKSGGGGRGKVGL